MTKASWCTVTSMSGNGDATLSISGTAHAGRTSRSTTAPTSINLVTAGASQNVAITTNDDWVVS